MKVFVILLCLLILSFSSSANQLDVAMIRFPEPKTESSLNESLSATTLNNSDRTKTKIHTLKGDVIFYQSLVISPFFSSSTRFSLLHSSLKGSCDGNVLSLDLTLSDGVDEALRLFSSHTFKGSLRVVSFRTIIKNTPFPKKAVLIQMKPPTPTPS